MKHQPNEIKDKVAIITGASRGIGAATAKELATLGAKVILLARSTAKLQKVADEIIALGGQAISTTCDVTRYTDVSSAIELCLKRYGRVDILVNNAGVIEPVSRLAESDPGQWCQVVDINLKGVYHGLRAAIPHMVKQNSGTIINISSGAATNALEGWSHYCCTKAAVLSLTKCVDREYRDQGITCIGLSPGTVATQMQMVIRESGINRVSQLDPASHIPAEWAARAVAWLCTKQAKQLAGTDFSLKTNQAKKRIGLQV